MSLANDVGSLDNAGIDSVGTVDGVSDATAEVCSIVGTEVVLATGSSEGGMVGMTLGSWLTQLVGCIVGLGV